MPRKTVVEGRPCVSNLFETNSDIEVAAASLDEKEGMTDTGRYRTNEIGIEFYGVKVRKP